MTVKERTDDKTFGFRNNLLWTGLEGNYFFLAKTFEGNEKSFVQSKHCVNDA